MKSDTMLVTIETNDKSSSWKWLHPVIIFAPAVIILIILTVVQPLGTASGPQSVMAKAYEETSQVNSYRFSFTGVSDSPDGFHSEQTIEAEFTSPESCHVKMVENGESSEFILIGDKYYVGSGHVTGAVIFGFSRGLSGMFSKEAVLGYLDMLKDIQELPDEKIEGITCIHYLGKWDVEKQIAESKRSLIEHQAEIGIEIDEEEIDKQMEPMRAVNIEIELWIGKDDYLIRQMKIDGEFPDDEEGVNITMVTGIMTYYDLNQPITIEAPLDADGRLLPGWRMSDAPSIR